MQPTVLPPFMRHIATVSAGLAISIFSGAATPLDPPPAPAPGCVASPRAVAVPLDTGFYIQPAHAVNRVNLPHTVTVTLNRDGQPIVDAAILFSVTGVNILADRRLTNASGETRLTYSGGIPGRDEIRACYDIDNDGTCAEGEAQVFAAKSWVDQDSWELTLSPDTAISAVGTPHAVAAMLTNHGVGVAGQRILLRVSGANAAEGVLTTDENGIAEFVYIGTAVGEDLIEACHDANVNGRCEADEASATAAKQWTAARGLELTLEPPKASNLLNTTHTLTATLVRDGNPIVNAAILFRASGANPGSSAQQTGRGGKALYTYTGVNPGRDTVTACHDADLSTQCDPGEVTATAFKDWSSAADNRPPDCGQVTARPAVLWPPNHRFGLVALLGASDPDGDPVEVEITGVTQDEPLAGTGAGDKSPDARRVEGGGQVWLRAERSPRNDGRVYRIGYVASDGRGGSCSGTVLVGVPHDRRGSPAGDSGPIVDSFGP